MTGFGEASSVVDGVHYGVEVRSLNNKFFKASIRLADDIQGLEAEIDSILRQRLGRGSITVTVRSSDPTATAAYEINIEAMRRYLAPLSDIARQSPGMSIDLGAMVGLPGVLQPPADFAQRVDRVRPIVTSLVDAACDSLIQMRAREGATLLTDLQGHLAVIERRLTAIAQRAPEVVEDYHQRLRQRVQRMLADAGVAVNESDFVRELAVYAERSDIGEEIARLTAHLAQFGELIDRRPAEPVGRTLDFLSQEMLREANTIASKSNDAPISREIVEIKGAIDRIKEQVQNAE